MKQQLTLLALVFSGAAVAQTYTPITATGYNLDAVAETAPAINSTAGTLDANDYVLYSAAYGNVLSTGSGLPDNGLIVNAGRTYQLQPYNQDNVMLLSTGQSDSLELTTPASYSSISLLGFSTEGSGTLLVVLKFTDGSGTVINSSTLPDWFFNPNAIISGFDRTGRTTDQPDFQFDDPRMYALDITLSCADQAKLLEEILIVNTTPSPSIKTAVFAVSGSGLLNASAGLVTNVQCNGAADGTATVETTGGAYPLTYEWSTTPAQTGAQATGLAPGTYSVITTDAGGCADTVEFTEITEPAPIFSGQAISLCPGSDFQVGTSVYTAAGNYVDTLQAINGCDSIVSTIIEMAVVETGATLTASTLTATASGAQYQWIDCGNNNAVIAGATSQSFNPSVPGNYAVIVTENNCSDTSACINVAVISVNELGTVNVQLYPNPVSDELTIQSSAAIVKAEVTDLAGTTVEVAISNNRIGMQQLAAGTYLVRLTTATGAVSVSRVVKK